MIFSNIKEVTVTSGGFTLEVKFKYEGQVMFSYTPQNINNTFIICEYTFKNLFSLLVKVNHFVNFKYSKELEELSKSSNTRNKLYRLLNK